VFIRIKILGEGRIKMMHELPDQVRQMVEKRFIKVAKAPRDDQKFPVGPESAKALGYDANEIERMLPSVTESFCGVGNPLGLGKLRSGETVLDLGSGAGLDCILTAQKVGATGKVIGVDMTQAMVEKARHNVAVAGLENVEIHQGYLEQLPLENDSVDVAISNGVFNLCPNKPKVLSEVLRVLRPGGRLQMADILLHDHVTTDEVATKGAWSD
jgi:arsenite methyltransferase